MPVSLDPEGLAEALRLGKGVSLLAGIDGVFDIVVTGRSGGDVTIRSVVRDGRWIAAGLGGPGRAVAAQPPGDELDWSSPAEVQWTVPDAEGSAILAGELDPTVAFMRGRLKTAGAPGVVLKVLAAAAGEAFAVWRDRLAALEVAPVPARSSE